MDTLLTVDELAEPLSARCLESDCISVVRCSPSVRRVRPRCWLWELLMTLPLLATATDL